MKKKLFNPLILVGVLLTGCSSNAIYGTYSFQMGKDNGFHLKAQMVLSKEDYQKDDVIDGKQFTFTLDIGSTPQEDKNSMNRYDKAILDSNNEDSDIDISSLISFLPNPFSLEGHYSLGEKTSKGRRKLNLSFTILDDIEDLLDIILGEENDSSEEIVNYLVYVEMSNSNIYFTIPVSLDDIIFQLYWYGYDIDNTEEIISRTTPHSFGSVPSLEDIELINQTYPSSHDGKKYRIFHTLELGLIKD